MKKTIFAAIAALLIATPAIGSDQKCIAWSNDCEPQQSSAKWEATLHFDGQRDPETASYDHGAQAQSIGEQACNRTTTLWNPEPVTRVEVTNTANGQTTVVHCS